MAREGVHFWVSGVGENHAEAPRSVPRWWRGPNPDPAEVARLYVQEQRTEFEISVLLSISSMRVAAILRDAGVPRRTARKQCPVDPHTLRLMVQGGATRNSVAGKFGVSAATAARWFTEAGLLGPDPKIDAGRLRELYVDRQLTTREVAAELGVTKERVIRALTAAGIAPRPRSVRRPQGPRAAVTDEALAQVYQRPGMTIEKTRKHFGVSEAYLRRRIAEAGLTRRPGTFVPRTGWSPSDLRDKAVELYATGLTLKQVGARLGVSPSTIKAALDAAKAPVRPGGGTRPEALGPPRVLIADLYADPDVVAALRRHQVHVPGDSDWHVGSFHTYVPMPVPPALLQELYTDVGLATYHIGLLMGLGTFATRRQLVRAGVTLRPSRVRCPWNQRRSSDA